MASCPALLLKHMLCFGLWAFLQYYLLSQRIGAVAGCASVWSAGLSLGSLQRRTSGPEDPTWLPGKSCSRAAAVGDVNPLVKFTFPSTFV